MAFVDMSRTMAATIVKYDSEKPTTNEEKMKKI